MDSKWLNKLERHVRQISDMQVPVYAANACFFLTLSVFPMLLLVLITITGAVTVWLMKGSECEWPVTAMGLTAISLLIALIAVLRSEFLLELKRRFHVK